MRDASRTARRSRSRPSRASLYRRVLRDHQETGFDEPERADEIVAVADTLGRLATAGLENAGVAGRTASRINIAVIEELSRQHPEWIPDENEEDAEEAFARGASQLLRETLVGRRSFEKTVAATDALARAVLAASRQREEHV